MAFDAETLSAIDRTREVDIETVRPDGSVRSTTIWIVVDGTDVLARSWRGERGYWFRSATDAGALPLTLVVGGRRLAVRALLAGDETSIERSSRQFQRKYAGDPSLAGMLRPEVLHTTLRLEPA